MKWVCDSKRQRWACALCVGMPLGVSLFYLLPAPLLHCSRTLQSQVGSTFLCPFIAGILVRACLIQATGFRVIAMANVDVPIAKLVL